MRRPVLLPLLVLMMATLSRSQTAPPWKQFSEIVGHFSILMPDYPGAPKLDVRGTGDRGEYSLRMYTLYSGKGDQTVLYGVGYLDYKSVLAKAAPQDFLDSEVLSILQDSKAKPEGIGKIQYRLPELYPGRELRFTADKVHIESYAFSTGSVMDELPPGVASALGKTGGGSPPRTVLARIFLANHRVYVLFCMAQPGAFDPRAAHRFLDSFQLSSPFLIP
jgi:hypothetical protein